MTRTQIIAGPAGSITVELTKEQNDARDLEEQEWADGATTRNALAEIQRLEGQVTNRRLRDAYADSTWLDAQEALIATERAKLAE
jgi:hypothetical protein